MRVLVAPAAALTVTIVSVVAPALVAQRPASPAISVLSSRADMVSGGDALLRVDGPVLKDFRVVANDRDVTAAFHPAADGGGLEGIVTGLRDGANAVVATGRSGRAAITLVNYPVAGPIISGPHEQPYICDSERFRMPAGEKLGAALDADCRVNTRVDYYYRGAGSDKLKPLVDPTAPPADAARATTSAGATIPYVVRIETGTINRGIYQIATLQGGWNRRLIYTFGGGCPGGWLHQGAATGGVDDDAMLREGYAVASSSLNVFGNNCNDLLAAETMMMVKERFIEANGVPLFTIGWGCSGGSYQAHQIADNYPGLLDGIVVGCSFPDVGFTSTSVHSFGARLLYHYFENAAVAWTRDQQVAASGLPNYDSLSVQGTRPDRISPRGVCDASVPVSLLYDARTNPRGARCTIYDHTVNVYGRDPRTGFARRFLDNVGVQYGLRAMTAGAITPGQFLDLNERIGGIDIDANFVAPRTIADLDALRAGYETGRILNGGGGLAETPIIDYRGYADFAKGDPHMRFYSFATRERLIKANGRADNQVMLIEDGATYGLFSTKSPVLRNALQQMDRWLTTLVADGSADSRARKVVRAKPGTLIEGCYDRGGAFLAEPQRYDAHSACNELFPPHASPYLVAGMPLSQDVVKCRLKRIDADDYEGRLTPAEITRLSGTFPSGVCDYSKPGVEQRPLRGTWLSFGPSPVNRATPPDNTGGPKGRPPGAKVPEVLELPAPRPVAR